MDILKRYHQMIADSGEAYLWYFPDGSPATVEASHYLDFAARARGSAPSFEIYGQPGCRQDAAVLFGIQELIMETFDDPKWVRELLEILKRRKLVTIASMKGANFDIIETGGGDASSTVISPEETRQAVRRCFEGTRSCTYA